VVRYVCTMKKENSKNAPAVCISAVYSRDIVNISAARSGNIYKSPVISENGSRAAFRLK